MKITDCKVGDIVCLLQSVDTFNDITTNNDVIAGRIVLINDEYTIIEWNYEYFYDPTGWKDTHISKKLFADNDQFFSLQEVELKLEEVRHHRSLLEEQFADVRKQVEQKISLIVSELEDITRLTDGFKKDIDLKKLMHPVKVSLGIVGWIASGC